ncbi:MAG TPA: Ig-like domain-containing protein, partial [Armatimonadota bacterium]|nr:Ig-like domain-containing protein [Armatimonadota bacterium]
MTWYRSLAVPPVQRLCARLFGLLPVLLLLLLASPCWAAAPVAQDDAATTWEDTPLVVGVLGNDSDEDLDPLTITAVSDPAHGATAITDAGTTVTYTPDTDWFGEDTFTYTISDGNGGTDTATVTMTVTAVNDAPIGVDDSATTAEDTAVLITVLSNDTDVESDPLALTGVEASYDGITEIVDNQVRFTPYADWSGTTTFYYYLTDGQGGYSSALVTVTVTPVQDPPLAADDWGWTDEDIATTLYVTWNDWDPDGDPLTITAVTHGAHGTVVIDPGAYAVTYTPDLNWYGEDSFTYTVSDGNGNTATAAVTVTVSPVNDWPVAQDDTATTPEDTPVLIDVLSNDS